MTQIDENAKEKVPKPHRTCIVFVVDQAGPAWPPVAPRSPPDADVSLVHSFM